MIRITVLLALLCLTSLSAQDPRNIRNGLVLPDEDYCDQPYVVPTRDGAWLCVMTTGSRHEGATGQHVVALRSTDHGQTWSKPVDLEPANGPVASWGMPLVTSFGRIYVFYSYNGDKIAGRRADMLGWYCYRYSDDDGKSWSKRHRLPLRVTAADRGNDWQGQVQIFWGIGKPITVGKDAIFAFTKIGRYMLDRSEGWFFRSDNVLTQRDISKVNWTLLPEGDHGLRAAAHGSIQSEQNLVALSNGDLYCMYRTTMGYPCHAYSRDGGRSWSKPVAATYTPGGRRFKHPRACPRLWRTRSGRYLFWFHNNGNKDWSPGTRNPCWLVGGVERDGYIHWSQPEIVLYDPDEKIRISYPDLIEEGGRYWITETQKSVARVHEIDPSLLEGLWRQESRAVVVRDGLADANNPILASLDDGAGFSIDVRFTLPAIGGNALAKLHDGDSNGLALQFENGTLVLRASAGKQQTAWQCDRDLFEVAREHHVVVTADGGPGILSWVVDGVLCDGGTQRVRGWQRFRTRADKKSVLGEAARAASGNRLEPGALVHGVRIYSRALRTSEAVSNYRSGK